MRVESSIIINRPTHEVWSYSSLPKNAPDFAEWVEERKQTTEGPMGIGARGQDVTKMLGRRFKTTWEVTEWIPEEEVSVKSISGPLMYKGSCTYASVEGGTKVTVVFEVDLPGLFKLAEDVVILNAKRQIEMSNHNLKDILESRSE